MVAGEREVQAKGANAQREEKRKERRERFLADGDNGGGVHRLHFPS